MFEKLHKYIGRSVEALVNRPDAPHVFRLHKKVGVRRARRAARTTRRAPAPERTSSRAAATRAAAARAARALFTRPHAAAHVTARLLCA